MSLVDRQSGRSKSFVVDKVNRSTVLPIVCENVAREANMMTDAAYWYRSLAEDFAIYQSVDHSAGQYVRDDVHTNTIEGFFSIFKRGMKGVYQNCGEALHRYLAEFDFRYSHRVAFGPNDAALADLALNGAAGKRLLYRGSFGL